MGLKSLLKKASIGLGSLLLGCNIGCNRPFLLENNPDTDLQRPLSEQKNLEDKTKYSEPYKAKMWHYYPPLNILGGYYLRGLTHEGGHALICLAMDVEIEDFHPFSFISGKYSEYQPTWVAVNSEDYVNLSDAEKAISHIAGPVADVAMIETINYNLRNGKISEKYQPFWATTSLVYRWCLVGNALYGIKGQKGNDFCGFEEYTGVSKETSLGIIALYTALSAKRIKKEIGVAIGTDSYPVNDTKSRVDLVPYKDGLMVNYTLDF